MKSADYSSLWPGPRPWLSVRDEDGYWSTFDCVPLGDEIFVRYMCAPHSSGDTVQMKVGTVKVLEGWFSCAGFLNGCAHFDLVPFPQVDVIADLMAVPNRHAGLQSRYCGEAYALGHFKLAPMVASRKEVKGGCLVHVR